jgi:hypothetical protein
MASCDVWRSHALVGERHIDQRLLVVEATKMIHLLTLKLVLNTLAIRGIANKRKNWTNAFHQKCSLVRFRVVQCSLENISINTTLSEPPYLDAIVSIRIPQQLLKSRTIEKLFDQHLSRAVFGHTNALQRNSVVSHRPCSHQNSHLFNDIRAKFLNGQRTNIASELANYCITEAVVIQVEDILNNLFRQSVESKAKNGGDLHSCHMDPERE